MLATPAGPIPPLFFSGSRQRRTKGFNVKELRELNKIRRCPISSPSPPRKRSRLGNENLVVLEKDYRYEDEMYFLAPGTDPRTLCPYCDTVLPAHCSSKLVYLLDMAKSVSSSESRPANPLGRKAPMLVYASLCSRHHFESEVAVEGALNGWPTSIAWEELSQRVRAMKDPLQKILGDPGAPIVYKGQTTVNLETLAADFTGPRMECIFWTEVLQELKLKGSRQVAGVHGQFDTFKQMQPGYYGELGSVIIHETLYDLFPETSVNLDFLHPFDRRDFIGRILVPEVGMRLIMEDLSLDNAAAAVKVLRASASYGVGMFPADN
ncbi:RTC4-like domain-containing protein [Mycena alexandri]|uniref:Restriction of telomere capping protein 4 n=1 Tax=Mycena alexandri TaxID=1745969 RepID=A0AAD6X099_9AGAR|nr:RTC4-like domain-containing protein [Mycena alexandri]